MSTPAKKNTAFIFYMSLVSQANTKIMQAAPTLAAGDFQVSIDGGALANLTTLPTVTPAAGKMVKLSLSAAEMNGDNLTVVCSDAAGAEWCDATVNIQTNVRSIDDLAFPATSGRSMVVDAAGLVDANAVKVGPTGAGTAQTAGDIHARLPAALTAGGNMKSDALAWNALATVALPLVPTVAGRTLDVSATGEAGLDWANIGAPTTVQNLSATNINVTQVVASVSGAVGSVTGLTAANLDTTVSSRATPAQVKTQMTDALNVDTYAEPGQATPAATTTLAGKIGYLFKAWRNRSTQTAATYKLFNDDAITVDQKSTTSDDGTTFDRTEVATGP